MSVIVTYPNESRPLPKFSDDAAGKVAFIGLHTWTGEIRCLDETGHVANAVADESGEKCFTDGDSILGERLVEYFTERTGRKFIADDEARSNFSVDHPDHYIVWKRQ